VNAIRRAYECALLEKTPRVAESTKPDNELAWQARWFSGACGRDFTTTSGSEVMVTDFGQWNREAGPDFVNAVIRIDGKDTRGAVEVDLSPSGWEQHGHATNAAYENVVLHVVVQRSGRRHFSRTLAHREVPQVCLADHEVAAAEWLGAAAARPGRCVAPLRTLHPHSLCDLLTIAARRRFEHKGSELRRMIASRGIDAALYEAVAIGLGYKNNKLPFQLLAQRVPLRMAASKKGEALLFGVAGFLERPEPPSGAAKSALAQLWSAWWKQRASFGNSVLPRPAWNLAGIRPANHPLRRIAALSALAREWKGVRRALESADLDLLENVLGSLQHPFWSYHAGWNSPCRETPLALIGADRIREIYANIALPLAVACGHEPAWADIPSGAPNTSLRVAAARLFGGPLPRSLPKRMFVHQGLLQIYADFCLRDRGECADCRFPSLVAGLPA